MQTNEPIAWRYRCELSPAPDAIWSDWSYLDGVDKILLPRVGDDGSDDMGVPHEIEPLYLATPPAPPALNIDDAAKALARRFVHRLSASDSPEDSVWHITQILRLHFTDVAAPPAPPIVDVVAAVRRDSSGNVWLAKRNRNGAHAGLAGMWEYPGGKVEQGEQLREALVRELNEEFGEADRTIGAVLDSITYQQYRVTFFAVTMGEPTVLNNHDEVRWMTPAEACAVEHLPSGTIFNAKHLASSQAGAPKGFPDESYAIPLEHRLNLQTISIPRMGLHGTGHHSVPLTTDEGQQLLALLKGEDTARMDWLEADGALRQRVGEVYTTNEYGLTLHRQNGMERRPHDLRMAIDAVMRK